MKASPIFSNRGTLSSPRNVRKRGVFTALVVLISIGLGAGTGWSQAPDNDVPGAEVLTRGPVHEGFAGIVTFNPEPGVVVTKAPPDIIEEVPPEDRPEGDNVTWIPGYWAWDDERSDFLWVSGTWRALPPGRQWMAGYWGKTPQGYQWTSGYWADAAATEATYLPPPPATVEAGPNIVAPSPDYGWSPGCWLWYEGRYAWRPGYWAQGRADWDWMPAHYVWTPRGYIFVGGFWDYPVERRGILFAPVYFDAGMYANFPGFIYAKGAGRQLTNQFRVPPGGGVALDTGAQQNIRDAIARPLIGERLAKFILGAILDRDLAILRLSIANWRFRKLLAERMRNKYIFAHLIAGY